MLGFRLPFARRKGYGMGAAGGGGWVPPSSLLTSLISYWTLEEASGTRYDSVITSANDLTDNNTVTQNPGKQGNAGQFTSSNTEYLTHADNDSLSTGNIDFTIAAWIYLDNAVGGTGRVIVAKASTLDLPNAEFGMVVNNAQRAQFDVWQSSAAQSITASTFGPLSTLTWYFVVVWVDTTANTVNIQVNNGTVDSTTKTKTPINGTAGFSIGSYENAVNTWNGRIDEVGFWKRVLTATERTNLYNSGNGVTYPFTGVP